MKRRYIDYNGWDEDFYPTHGEFEEEYFEDYEDESDDYPVGYTSIQGNWDFDALEDEDSFQKIGRKTRKIQSVKTYDAVRARERKNQQKKIRSEAKIREKHRQKYYHYGDEE